MGAKNVGQDVNKTELCAIMGVTPPTVDGWVRNGCPIKQKGARGVAATFNTSDVMKWLQARAREEASGDAAVDERELKRRKLAAETAKAELELAKARGDVAPVREFERTTAALMAAIRANVMNVPGRAVLQLLGETDEITFKGKLRAELVLALETASAADFDIEDEEEAEADA